VPTGGEATAAAVRRQAETVRRGTVDWAAVYARMLSAGAPAFRQVFAAVTRPDALPAVVHCAGGRDRTGLVAALLLAALGVADDVIAGDYARTGALLRPHVDRFVAQQERMAFTRDDMLRLLETTEEPMLRVLLGLREQYGSPAGYLESIGVEAATVTVLRAGLVEVA